MFMCDGKTNSNNFFIDVVIGIEVCIDAPMYGWRGCTHKAKSLQTQKAQSYKPFQAHH